MGAVGNGNAVRHGAHSTTKSARIEPVARNHRRRVLRQLRLSPRDLDAVGRGFLDQYVRTISKVELIDAYIEEHGMIRADGEPQPVMRVYVSLVNSARLSLQRLADHLRKRPAVDVLEAYVDETYGAENGA